MRLVCYTMKGVSYLGASPAEIIEPPAEQASLVWLSPCSHLKACLRHWLCCQIPPHGYCAPCSGLKDFPFGTESIIYTVVWLLAVSLSARPSLGLPVWRILLVHNLPYILWFYFDFLITWKTCCLHLKKFLSIWREKHSIIWSLVEIKLAIVEWAYIFFG